MKAYKVFDSDWKCRGMQYEVGKEFSVEGEIIPCRNGLHACFKLADCFSYYDFNPNNKVAEVEIIGKIVEGDNKITADRLLVVKEISWQEVLEMVNTGKNCTGFLNSGHQNSGHHNSGNWNSGNLNSDTPTTVRVFNKNCKRETWDKSDVPNFLRFDLTKWVSHDAATESEREQYKKEIETSGGFFKTIGYKEAFKLSYDQATQEDKDKLKKLPNWNARVFFEISGIMVE